jgi:signal transduction histidine kinase
MGPSSKQQQSRLLAEVSHQINSPLAAIRNALYLAGQCTDDPQILEYLALANVEVTSIVSRMKDLRENIELGMHPEMAPAAPPGVHVLRKAA